ncbi:hypothetical protein ATCC90586_006200 [Pythium insidiosum]|nr:hypothetical protein ATCC90586_006200 [Pythium insidiosum]
MADHARWLLPAFRDAILRRRDGAHEQGKQNAFAFETVSFRESAIPWAAERQLRWTTCSFIEDLAQLVAIPDAPALLAQLYVQRFYSLHSFATHDRFLVATAALFLAAKSEEFPIKVRLMTECAMYLLHCKPKDEDRTPRGAARQQKNAAGRPVEMSSSLGNDPKAANAKHLDCLHALLEVIDVGEIELTASRVLLTERILLQSLSFDLSIPQPFAYVARQMDPLFALEAMHEHAPYEVVRSLAFLLLADAVKSGLVLAFSAPDLAAGAIYLSCVYRRHVAADVTTAKDEPWWSLFGLSAQQLEDVASGLLWMYEDDDGQPRAGLSAGLRELWDRYRPDDNRPDLDAVRRLDATLQLQQPTQC